MGNTERCAGPWIIAFSGFCVLGMGQGVVFRGAEYLFGVAIAQILAGILFYLNLILLVVSKLTFNHSVVIHRPLD